MLVIQAANRVCFSIDLSVRPITTQLSEPKSMLLSPFKNHMHLVRARECDMSDCAHIVSKETVRGLPPTAMDRLLSLQARFEYP